MSNNNTEESLKSLESLYVDSNLEGALELSLKEKDQLSPGHFYYNLGSIYAKQGDLANGRFYLEKAFKEGFDVPKVTHNLNIVKNNLKVREFGEAGGVFGTTFSYLLNVHPSYYMGTTLSLLILSVALFRFKFIKKGYLLAALIIFSLIPFSFSRFYLNKMDFGIALEEVEIHEGPSNIYDSIGALRPGQKIILGEKDNGWVFIKYPESFRGWISKEKLGLF